MTQPLHPMLNSTNRFIASLGELSPLAEVRAEIVRILARTIDRINTKQSPTSTATVALMKNAKQYEVSIELLKQAASAS